jgi:hypothetical protein
MASAGSITTWWPSVEERGKCVGVLFAYRELYVTLGTLFRRFPRGLQVWKRTPETITDYDDFFLSYHLYSRRRE